MSTPEPPPYPGDPQPEGTNDLPSYGSVQPPGDTGGAAPPPPPPPAGPGAPLTSGGFSAPEAIAWGWRRFTENVGPVLLAALFAVAVFIAVGVVGTLVTAVLGGNSPRMGFDQGFGMGFGMAEQTPGFADIPSQVLQNVAGAMVSALFAKAALDVADGAPFNLFGAFGRLNFVNVLVLGLLLGIATTIGFLLCILPGIVIAFLTFLSTYALVDGEGQSPIEAIKTSYRLVTANLGESLLLILLCILVVIAGALALCVGLLVALPVTTLATAYAYRWFSGRPVAG